MVSDNKNKNVYVGHRYVPKIFGVWDKLKTYEPLSIVTWEGVSYTSKKRVPEGVDILNEEYWVVTGNYNAQVENYRQEVRDMQDEVDSKVDQDEFDDSINTINGQLTQIAVYPDDFKDEEDYDNTQSIIRAINYCKEKGGGNVIISKNLFTSSLIIVEEGVMLDFKEGGRITYTEESGSVLTFARYSKAKNVDIEVSSANYNGVAILISTKYTKNNTGSYLHGLKIYKPFSKQSESVGVKFEADSEHSNSHSGFWEFNLKDGFIDGFNCVIMMETLNSGWVNGNNIINVTADNFENFVIVNKSEESRGIDLNYFNNLNAQVRRSKTKELLLDFDSNNIYDNCHWYDIRHVDGSSFGYAKNFINFKLFDTRPIQFVVANMYESFNYQKIGTFKQLSSISHYVVLSFKGRGLNSEITIEGVPDGNARVTRRHYGETILDNNLLKFYVSINENGLVDLYMKSTVTWDVSVYVVGYSNFMVNSIERYDTIDNVIELNNDKDLIKTDNIYCFVRSYSGNDIPPTGDGNIITFEEVSEDKFGMFNDNRFYALFDGTYEISGVITFTPLNDESGYRQVGFIVNSDRSYTSVLQKPTGIGISTILSFNDTVNLKKGDYIEVTAKQRNDNNEIIPLNNVRFNIKRIGTLS